MLLPAGHVPTRSVNPGLGIRVSDVPLRATSDHHVTQPVALPAPVAAALRASLAATTNGWFVDARCGTGTIQPGLDCTGATAGA